MAKPTLNLTQLSTLIQKEPGVAVYFSAPRCGVCHVLKPKLELMFKEEFPLIPFIEINIPDHPDISGQHRVFTAPTLLVFLDGKEYLRSVRNMGVAQIMEKLKRPYFLLMN